MEEDGPVSYTTTLQGSRRPTLQFCAEGAIGQRRVARAEDDILAKVAVELGFQRLLDVDGCQDPEPLRLQCIRSPRHRVSIRNIKGDA